MADFEVTVFSPGTVRGFRDGFSPASTQVRNFIVTIPMPQPATPRKRRVWPWVLVIALVAMVGGCGALVGRSHPVAQPAVSESATPSAVISPDAVAPGGFSPVVVTPAPAADPFTTDGEWLVPSQIASGSYKAIPRSIDGIGGYIEVCSNLDCAIGAGMIHNYLVDGPTYFTIPATAVMVKFERVTITAQN